MFYNIWRKHLHFFIIRNITLFLLINPLSFLKVMSFNPCDHKFYINSSFSNCTMKTSYRMQNKYFDELLFAITSRLSRCLFEKTEFNIIFEIFHALSLSNIILMFFC